MIHKLQTGFGAPPDQSSIFYCSEDVKSDLNAGNGGELPRYNLDAHGFGHLGVHSCQSLRKSFCNIQDQEGQQVRRQGEESVFTEIHGMLK